jgi:hypothetical protein
VGGGFEARQLLAKDKPETRHAGTIEEVLDYANDRGAEFPAFVIEERGGYALQYRPAPHRTWRVLDSDGRSVTGYEYSDKAQALAVLDARAGQRND